MGGLAVAEGATPPGGLGANCIACGGDLYFVPDC